MVQTTLFEVIAEMLLAISLLVLMYTYFGYPVILWIWSSLGRNPVKRCPITPSVSIVIAAWNEADRLPARIENCLQQQYPTDLLEVVVVSDGSTDDTEVVVGRFNPDGVQLVKLENRMGKALALNHGVAAARGDVIVFADARQRFGPDAVANLVANFADRSVGAVSGQLILEFGPAQAGADGVGLYWRVEKWIRRKEATIDSAIGATGAIYAIRRDLFEPLPEGTILDDVLIPMRIAMKGYRVVFEARAQAFDYLSQDYRHEFRRKVRTLAGNYQAISLCHELINPSRNRLFLQFFSHKVCRLLGPFALLGLFLANLALFETWWVVLLYAQIGGYALALAGWGLTKRGIYERWTSIAFSFCLLNWAAIVGAMKFLRNDERIWDGRAF